MQTHDNRTGTAAVDAEAPQAVNFRAQKPGLAEGATKRRSRGWKGKAAALALASAAMIGAVFALEGGLPQLPKEPDFLAAAHGPGRSPPPGDETVAGSKRAGAPLVQSSAESTGVKAVNSERQPVDPTAQAPLAKASLSAASASATTTQPAAEASSGAPAAASVDTPVVAAPAAAPPPPQASQFPDHNPARTVSLLPDQTPIAAPISAATDSPEAPSSGDASKPAANAAPKATTDAAGRAQPSTAGLDLPTQHSGKSSGRVLAAKTHAANPGDAAETPSEPHASGKRAKHAKTASAPKTAQAAAEPVVAPAAPAAPPEQPVNPLLHAFPILGAVGDALK